MHSMRISPGRGLLENFAAAAYLAFLFVLLAGCAAWVGIEAFLRLAFTRGSGETVDEE